MNYAPELLDYLTKRPDLREIILGPNAPPMGRTEAGLQPLFDGRLSAAEIRNTLTTLRSHSSIQASPVGTQGTFSFGIASLGRFRVSYMTQRSSFVLRLARVPVHIPALETLLEDPAAVETVDALFGRRTGGIVIVTGPSDARNRLLVYAALQRLSEREIRMIYILEKSMSYLLGHGRSIVFQSELDTDVTSVQEGIEAALQIVPDVMYVGDVVAHEDLLRLLKAAEMGVAVVTTLRAADEAQAVARFVSGFRERYSDFAALERRLVKVLPGADDKMRLEMAALP